MATSILGNPLPAITILCAVIAAALLVHYIVKRPPLNTQTKLLLLAGLGLFPILSAGSGSYAGFVQTTKRDFCGGCHVMEPWIKDAEDPHSTSLSAMHARNELFGDKSCYTCHADYGMFGTVATKIAGLHHVYGYLTKYWDTPLEEAVKTIKIFKPFPNSTCTHCHSTTLPGFAQVPDHKATADDATASCASKGCHGPAHPFASNGEPAAGPGAGPHGGAAPAAGGAP